MGALGERPPADGATARRYGDVVRVNPPQTVELDGRDLRGPTGAVVRLSPREADVVRYLRDRAGHDVAREALERDVWQHGTAVRSEAVRVAMGRLIARLDEEPSLRGGIVATSPSRWRWQEPSFDATFIGRTSELTALAGLAGSARSAWVTGPGGIGKSRLAAAWAGRDPCVDLRDVADGVGLDRAVRAAVPLSGSLDDGPPLAVGVSELGLRRLVLDGVDALPGPVVAELVAGLLSSVEGLQVVVTARRAPPGAASLMLRPLAPDVAARVLRANLHPRRVPAWDDVDDGALAALCARLGGLPLALRLAASRAAVFGPDALLASLASDGGALTDEPSRRLDDVVAWTVRSLDPTERRHLVALVAFGALPLDAPGLRAEALIALVDRALATSDGRSVRPTAVVGALDADPGDAVWLDEVRSSLARRAEAAFRTYERTGATRITEADALAFEAAIPRSGPDDAAWLALAIDLHASAHVGGLARAGRLAAVDVEALPALLRARLLARRARAWTGTPRRLDGPELARLAVELTSNELDEALRADVLDALVVALLHAGDPPGALAALVARIDGFADPLVRAWLDARRGLLVGFLARPDAEASVDLVRGAAGLLEQHGHHNRAAIAMLWVADRLERAGLLDEANDVRADLQAVAARADDPLVRATAGLARTMLDIDRARYHDVVAVAVPLVDDLIARGARVSAVTVLSNAWCAWIELGEHELAGAAIERADRIVRALGARHLLPSCDLARSALSVSRGRAAEAVEPALRALRAFEEHGNALLVHTTRTWLGLMHRLAGDPDAARAWLAPGPGGSGHAERVREVALAGLEADGADDPATARASVQARYADAARRSWRVRVALRHATAAP